MSGRPLDLLDPPKRPLGFKEIHFKALFAILLLAGFGWFFNWRVYLFGNSYLADPEKVQQIKPGPRSELNPAFEVDTGALKLTTQLDNGRPYDWMGKSDKFDITINGWSGYNMPYFHTRSRQYLWGCDGIEPHHPLTVAGYPAYKTQSGHERLMLFGPGRVLSIVVYQGRGLIENIKIVNKIDPHSKDFQIRWPLSEPIDKR
jgi:hypothetical protein